ncbi:MAG: YaaA family protein, partial [Muribaculaceae bacterium]
MQILLADAKLMHQSAEREPISEPLFQAEATMLAAEMARMTADELQRQFGCGASAAEEARLRFARFATAKPMPAILAYNGQAYKHLLAHTLGDAALAFGQDHLWITSVLYGILRPMDAIAPYRME